MKVFQFTSLYSVGFWSCNLSSFNKLVKLPTFLLPYGNSLMKLPMIVSLRIVWSVYSNQNTKVTYTKVYKVFQSLRNPLAPITCSSYSFFWYVYCYAMESTEQEGHYSSNPRDTGNCKKGLCTKQSSNVLNIHIE